MRFPVFLERTLPVRSIDRWRGFSLIIIIHNAIRKRTARGLLIDSRVLPCVCLVSSDLPFGNGRIFYLDSHHIHKRSEVHSPPFQGTRLMISVYYLLHPKEGSSRPSAAITILVLHSILLAFVVLTYFRLLYAIRANNDLVPRGSPCLSASSDEVTGITSLDRAAILNGTKPAPLGIAQFYSREVFICDPDGLPRWCGFCINWKPDRAHHCSVTGRCVQKFDHFCPL